MKPGRYFFSPKPNKQTPNTYIQSFYESLNQKVILVNNQPTQTGRSLDLVIHIFRAQHLVLNWPEDIIHLRFGVIQSFLFNLCVLIVKAKGGTITWICHNKKTHHNRLPILSKLNRQFFTLIADKIIVHSTDALRYLNKVRHKTIYLPHPRYDKTNHGVPKHAGTSTDVLIWGSITPYKGLHNFIDAYKLRNASFRVEIAGKADEPYYKELTRRTTHVNITVSNQLLSEAALAQKFQDTKIIVLPYLDSDTFSSGALIHSMNSEKIIIGPHLGNFIDLKNAGACLTYHDMDDLFGIIRQLLEDKTYYESTLKHLQQGITRYYNEHSWENFIDDFLTVVNYDIQPEIASAPAVTKRTGFLIHKTPSP